MPAGGPDHNAVVVKSKTRRASNVARCRGDPCGRPVFAHGVPLTGLVKRVMPKSSPGSHRRKPNTQGFRRCNGGCDHPADSRVITLAPIVVSPTDGGGL